MNINFGGKGSVTIDGRTFKGSTVSIKGNKVIIDGVEQDGTLTGDINVTVNGNVERLENTSGTVTVTGTAGSVKTVSGDVNCADVLGGITTVSGDVKCSGKVGGSVRTVSGSVK